MKYNDGGVCVHVGGGGGPSEPPSLMQPRFVPVVGAGRGAHSAAHAVTHPAAATAAWRWIFSSTHCFYSVSGETKLLLWSTSFISQPPPQEAKPRAQPSCLCFAACRCSLPRAALS